MTEIVHECQCAACLADRNREEWKIHHQMNVLLNRLDEQQRRWYVALESKKIGHGGDVELSAITGMDVETIRRGRREWMTIWPRAHSNVFEMRAMDKPRLKKRLIGHDDIRELVER